MLKEVEYCKEIMKNHFKKELVKCKNHERNFRKPNKCHVCNKFYSEQDI